MPALDYLPADLCADQVRACVAFISDTHMPRRCRAFPPALFEALRGADLLLHAGDVGDLWVLDQLSAIAPLVAVHGNDESGEATRALPFSTLVHLSGERIFLWHGHFPDWQMERDARLGDEILPKLQHTVDAARAAGAGLAVFGHWHIPLLFDAGDLLVVNPGAIASGNAISRRLHQTVAIAWYMAHAPRPRVVHLDVSGEPTLWDATVEWEHGFTAVSARYQQSILEPALAVQMPAILAHLPPESLAPLSEIVHGPAHRVWAGEAPLLTLEVLLAEVVATGSLPPTSLAELRSRLLHLAPPSH